MPHASRQQIVRYDIEDHCDLTDTEAERLSGALQERMANAHAALISDYGYGAVTQPLATALTAAAGTKPVTLDSRYDLLRFSGVTAATPNEEEAAAAAGTSLFNGDNDVRLQKAGEALREKLGSEALLITRGTRFHPGLRHRPGCRCNRRGRHSHRRIHAGARGGRVVRRIRENRQLCGRDRRDENGNGDRVERRTAARRRTR